MRASRKIKDYIRKAEGLELVPYPDGAGGSVGYGHYLGLGWQIHRPITKAQAEDYLDKDVGVAEWTVNKYVTVKLNQGQFDALVDFVYNRGSGTFQKSRLLRLINAEASPHEITDAFMYYNTSQGTVLPGLTKRRAYEAELFTVIGAKNLEKKQLNWGIGIGTSIIIIAAFILLWRWSRRKKK